MPKDVRHPADAPDALALTVVWRVTVVPTITVVLTPWSLLALAHADPHGSGVLARTEGSVAVA